MACTDCLQNCDPIISDQCVQYTGPDIPAFGICQGDTLSAFEADIVAQLQSALNGTGILITSVTLANCSFLANMFANTSPTLANYLQLLVNANCSLKAMIDAINATLGATTVFNTQCLTGLPANPTRDQVLQATVNLLCTINTTVNAFPSTYVQTSDLNTLVTNIVNSIISGGSSSQQNSKMVPNVAYEYYGPMSNFDSTGKGLSSQGFDKVYVCNGANGTPDKRGRVGVGAINGTPSGGVALDPAVDPSANPLNPNWALNDKRGETVHTLINPEMPVHTHPVNDPGHAHNYAGVVPDGHGSDAAKAGTMSTLQTTTNTTGITIGAAGGGQAHNNIQPSIAANYIMYIP